MRGDKSVDYGRVMEVMGLLSSAGFTHIGLVTDVAKPKPDAALERAAAAAAAAPHHGARTARRAGRCRLLLHAGLIAATYLTWSRMLDTSPRKPMPCRSI